MAMKKYIKNTVESKVERYETPGERPAPSPTPPKKLNIVPNIPKVPEPPKEKLGIENKNQKSIPFSRVIYAWLYYRYQRLCFSVKIERRTDIVSVIRTIKKIKYKYGISLRESKDIVDKIRD